MDFLRPDDNSQSIRARADTFNQKMGKTRGRIGTNPSRGEREKADVPGGTMGVRGRSGDARGCGIVQPVMVGR